MTLNDITNMVKECIEGQKTARDATHPVLIKCMEFALANTNDDGLADLRPVNQLVSGIQALGHMNIDGLIKWVLYSAGATIIPATDTTPAELDTSACVLRWKKNKFIFRVFKEKQEDGSTKNVKRPLDNTTVKAAFVTKWWTLNPKEQQPYKPKVLSDMIAALVNRANKGAESPKEGDNYNPELLKSLNAFAIEQGIVQ